MRYVLVTFSMLNNCKIPQLCLIKGMKLVYKMNAQAEPVTVKKRTKCITYTVCSYLSLSLFSRKNYAIIYTLKIYPNDVSCRDLLLYKRVTFVYLYIDMHKRGCICTGINIYVYFFTVYILPLLRIQLRNATDSHADIW